MRTEDLIDQLSAEIAPMQPGALARTLVAGVGGGALGSLFLMLVWLGPRPDLGTALSTIPFWIKFAFSGTTAAIAFSLALRLARPDVKIGLSAFLVLAPLAAILALALVSLLSATPTGARQLVMGSSARVCTERIIMLSLPIFFGTALVMRRLAPTRLTLAGAAAGLVAGAAGAWIYAFHCDESAAPFVAIWYTLGIAGTSLLGALLGRAVLRW